MTLVQAIGKRWRKSTKFGFGHNGWFRWVLAYNVLAKRKDTCWTKVVMWALFEDFWEVLNLIPSGKWYGFNSIRPCRKDARHVGSCYCGKFATEAFAKEAGMKQAIIVGEQFDDLDYVGGNTVITFKD